MKRNLDKFRWNAKKYNYDSQAYIYRKLFGYEMVFIAIDKNTGKIGLFDCSPDFYQSGKDKVEKACEMYELFHESVPVILKEDDCNSMYNSI